MKLKNYTSLFLVAYDIVLFTKKISQKEKNMHTCSCPRVTRNAYLHITHGETNSFIYLSETNMHTYTHI